MTRKQDGSNSDAPTPNEGRARQAKGSVQEAIGKIIGDAAVERRGSRESEAGARQAKADQNIDKNDDD